MRVGVLALALVWAGCSVDPATGRAFCSTDGDCGSGQSCVADLTQGSSYCSSTGCSRDSDCPPDQRCRIGVSAQAGGTELSVCVDRVRSCEMSERCDGLDNDCDGVVDGASCAPITACLDDLPCGAFVCTPAVNQPLALCAPPNDAASRPDFERCTRDEECRNGVCETGLCSPLCRPSLDEVSPGSCPVGYRCTRAVGSGQRPAYNTCQPSCRTARECQPSEACVWRDVYQGVDEHMLVCARPEPTRLPLGQSCTRDDECQTGLCFCRTCTRPCANLNDDCTDIGAGAVCQQEELRYGLSFVAQLYICVAARCGD
ncbi:MAG: hypothetical protein IT384_26610 [Deltaproteobacteria bacterium]|nr:hypothetical protein [Deltaproteobacteria bacterium]